MTETSAVGTAEYSYPLKEVFDKSQAALKFSSNFSLVEIDKVGSRLILETGASLSSWGESITIEFSSRGSKNTAVIVRSSFRRNSGSSDKLSGNRNQRNVNQVISIMSGALESANISKSNTASSAADNKTNKKVPINEQLDEYVASDTVSSLVKQTVIIAGAGLIVLFMVFAFIVMRPSGIGADEKPNSSSEPMGTSSSAPAAPSPNRDSESNGQCSEAAIAVTMVRSIFSDTSATPAQVSLILNEAAEMWAMEAKNSSGAKREWLLKMNELSLDVDSYLISGSPADGGTKLDQLFANMGLVDNFC